VAQGKRLLLKGPTSWDIGEINTAGGSGLFRQKKNCVAVNTGDRASVGEVTVPVSVDPPIVPRWHSGTLCRCPDDQ